MKISPECSVSFPNRVPQNGTFYFVVTVHRHACTCLAYERRRSSGRRFSPPQTRLRLQANTYSQQAMSNFIWRNSAIGKFQSVAFVLLIHMVKLDSRKFQFCTTYSGSTRKHCYVLDFQNSNLWRLKHCSVAIILMDALKNFIHWLKEEPTLTIRKVLQKLEPPCTKKKK